MKLLIYAVRDRQIDDYGQPFMMLAHGQAIRNFTDQVNDETPNNALNKHPEDYDLYTLGEFNTSTGTFDTKTPEQIAIGKNVRMQK